MTHILFIKSDGEVPPSLRDAFSAPHIRVIAKPDPEEAASAIERDAFNLAVIYEERNVEQLRRHLAALRAANQGLPVLVVGREYSLEAEQVTFDEGGELYFAEPLPRKSLERIIRQHFTPQESVAETPAETQPRFETGSPSPASPVPALQILRDFSHVLGFSLDYKAFTHHFILKLRDYISFSRIGIFLEAEDTETIARKRPSRTLACIASFGLPSDLVECFQLSRDVGIGRALNEQPRILQIGQSRASRESGIKKEFAILGCHIAIPINDRERCIGAAVLSGPVTGRDYSEDELQLLYLLMEELGLAVRNSRLHAGLAAHGQLINNVLRSMASGALVLSENLEVLYANDSAKSFLDPAQKTSSVEWADLPSKLAAPIHRAVEKGELPEPFLMPGEKAEGIYRISIIPFSIGDELPLLPRPVMVMIEDFTNIEASKQVAMEDTRSELIALMAERFAHEIRNSLVPLTTHMQLIDKRIDQPKFRASLKSAMAKETGRIKRFSDQMLYLAQQSNPVTEETPLAGTVAAAFERVAGLLPKGACELDFEDRSDGAPVQGNVEALRYAIEEILLNATQASDPPTKITVRLLRNDEDILQLAIRDSGPGFSTETLAQALEPFYTTRNTGVGLGLSVARKIIEEHAGFLRLNARSPSADWDIFIELPVAEAASTSKL